MAGVRLAGGCVSVVAQGALFTVRPRGVVLAAGTGDGALAGVEVTVVRVFL